MGRSGMLAALVWVMGCAGGTPAPTGNTISTNLPDPTTPTETADTGTGPIDRGSFQPDLFELNAFFAWDEKTNSFSNYAIPDQGLANSSFAVTFFDIAQQIACRITFEIEGRPPTAKWTKAQGAWVGLDVPTDAPVVNGCEGYRFPEQFEDTDEGVLFHVRKWEWGFGVSLLDAATEEGLRNTLSAAEWAAVEPFMIGGVFYSDSLDGSEIADGGFTDIGTAIGFEVDGNFQIDTDGTGNPIPIQRQLVNTPNGVATGYYEVRLLLQGTGALTNSAGTL